MECDASLGWRCADSGALNLQHMSTKSICLPQSELCVTTRVHLEHVCTMAEAFLEAHLWKVRQAAADCVQTLVLLSFSLSRMVPK